MPLLHLDMPILSPTDMVTGGRLPQYQNWLVNLLFTVTMIH